MPRVMVTGGSGYVASKLLPKLDHLGYTIDTLDIHPCEMPFVSQKYTVDIVSHKHMPKIDTHYDIVIHTIATFDELQAMKVNYNGTRNAVDLLNYDRFILLSTCGVLNPYDRSAYTLSKAVAEMYVLEKCKLPTIVNLATVYGFSTPMNFAGLINMLLRDAIEKHELNINGDNEFRPIIHINDAANHIIKAIELDNETKVFYATTENVTKAQIAQTIIDNMPFAIHLTTESTRNDGYKAPVENPVTVKLEEGIKEMIGELV